MSQVISVNPFRCRLWRLHERLEEHIDEKTCSAEIESFVAHGQLVPVLGRRVHGEDGCDIELIYGARRLFVARHINVPLLVDLREISDQQAIVAMDIENRQRKDVSPYERGLSYARWLRSGCFASQEDLARALNVSRAQVSRLLKVAKLPSAIVSAFSSALEICENWGIDLVDALDNPLIRQPTLRKAREISQQSPRPSAREVYRQLMACGVTGRKPRKLLHDQVIKDDCGTPLFRIRQQHDAILLILPSERVSARCLDTIREAVAGMLSDQPRRDGSRRPVVIPDHQHVHERAPKAYAAATLP